MDGLLGWPDSFPPPFLKQSVALVPELCRNDGWHLRPDPFAGGFHDPALLRSEAFRVVRPSQALGRRVLNEPHYGRVRELRSVSRPMPRLVQEPRDRLLAP